MAADKSGGPHTCKYVVIERADKMIAIMGLIDDYRYHANLLEAYCNDNGIPAHWVGKPDLLEIAHPEVQVLGGGWMSFEPKRGRIVLYGSSKAYGRFDHNRLVGLISNIGAFPGFSWQTAD